ncbi:MAG: hypothetical protein FWC02_02895 [Firmicutes bacterium]|nr:hypothetical protein [Bacillota bacterium]
MCFALGNSSLGFLISKVSPALGITGRFGGDLGLSRIHRHTSCSFYYLVQIKATYVFARSC